MKEKPRAAAESLERRKWWATLAMQSLIKISPQLIASKTPIGPLHQEAWDIADGMEAEYQNRNAAQG